MNERIVLNKNFYGAGNIEKLLFIVKSKKGDEFILPIIDLHLGGDMPQKYKLIAEEVVSHEQLLLGCDMLGGQIVNELYQNIPISIGDEFIYSQHNKMTSCDDEVLKNALQEEILQERIAWSVTNDSLDGCYNIQLSIFRRESESPSLLSYETPPQLTDYEQKFQTITVYILFFKDTLDISKNSELVDASVFAGIGHLGFFAVDLKLFEEVISKEIGNNSANLVELFSTTNLVDKCLEEGVLIITWGIKPWHYRIYTDVRLLSSNSDLIISGHYKLKECIKELSVIPGDELMSWPGCMKKDWPKIIISGNGQKVILSLYVENGELGNETSPAYIIQRKTGTGIEVAPIVNYSFF